MTYAEIGLKVICFSSSWVLLVSNVCIFKSPKFLTFNIGCHLNYGLPGKASYTSNWPKVTTTTTTTTTNMISCATKERILSFIFCQLWCDFNNVMFSLCFTVTQYLITCLSWGNVHFDQRVLLTIKLKNQYYFLRHPTPKRFIFNFHTC